MPLQDRHDQLPGDRDPVVIVQPVEMVVARDSLERTVGDGPKACLPVRMVWSTDVTSVPATQPAAPALFDRLCQVSSISVLLIAASDVQRSILGVGAPSRSEVGLLSGDSFPIDIFQCAVRVGSLQIAV